VILFFGVLNNMYKKHKNCKLLTFKVLTYACYNIEEIKDGFVFIHYFRLAIHIVIFNFLVCCCKFKINKTSIFDIKIYCEGFPDFDV